MSTGVALAALSAVTIGVLTARAVTHSSGTDKVAMKEWGFAPKPASVKAGKVTFVVKNAGQLSHEFVVLKTKTAASKLPVKGTTAVASGLVGKMKQFNGGLRRS